jgi:cation transport ATPase
MNYRVLSIEFRLHPQMQDDLSKVAEAMHLGRRTLNVIQFNIAFAISAMVANAGALFFLIGPISPITMSYNFEQ